MIINPNNPRCSGIFVLLAMGLMAPVPFLPMRYWNGSVLFVPFETTVGFLDFTLQSVGCFCS